MPTPDPVDPSTLSSLRDHLDAVDRRLIDALAERQRLVTEVAAVKAGDGSLPIRDADREHDLLARVHRLAEDAGLDGYFASTLYREILRHSVRYQAVRQSGEAGALRVAYQGDPGCYSHSAARKHFAAVGRVGYEGTRTFGAAIDALKRGDADRALLPVENTTAGPISGVYDLLVEPGLHIVGEEILKVEHCLLALDDVPLSRIKRIGSHAQALAQCSLFLANLDDVRVDAEDDTAGAARLVAESGDLSRAAIAGEDAAALYGLRVVKRYIANRKENFTRFLVVATDPLEHDPRLPHKTSLVLSTDHQRGALARVLQVFADADINMTKLESRPSQATPFEFLFYIDIEGGVHEEPVREAVEAAGAHARSIRVLGSYPAFQAETSRAALTRAASGDGAPARPAATKGSAPAKAKRARLADRGDRPDTVIEVAGIRIGGDEPPVLIAGPCSV